MSNAQVLTADQMRAAEQRLFDNGMNVGDLMKVAAGGAAAWVRRIAAGRSVTVLCGPGNNGGDGYVIARRLKAAGLKVQIVAPLAPKTDAAREARAAWDGPVLSSGGHARGEILVDCLFGSGLARPLSAELALLLRDLAKRHNLRIAIDLPSGIASDTGDALNERLPHFDVTLVLGAWKFAHCLAHSRTFMGRMRLIEIGIASVELAARRVLQPSLSAPDSNAHKYSRGQCAVIAGEMPGAALLASTAAMRAGAGYVKLLGAQPAGAPAGLVCEAGALDETLEDERLRAVLIGPGLGRDDQASQRLRTALSKSRAIVLDADALHLIGPDEVPSDIPVIATPHDGELDALCRTFAVIAEGRMAKAKAVAKASGMVVLGKGASSFVASPDGRLAIGPPATSWLSIAGSGDVLAGIIASRLAAGAEAFEAACEGLWLHGEAARHRKRTRDEKTQGQ